MLGAAGGSVYAHGTVSVAIVAVPAHQVRAASPTTDGVGSQNWPRRPATELRVCCRSVVESPK